MAERLIHTPFGDFYAAEGDLIASHLAAHGAHNLSDLQTFLGVIKSGDTVVDIGAHIGTYAAAAAGAVGDEGTVVAFECFGPTYALLKRNMDHNCPQVKTVYGAVDNAERAYAVKTAVGNTGATRLTGADAGEATIPVITDIRAHVETAVNVIKIDVEGMEANVLEAISNILYTDKPAIMIEISRVELAARGRSCEEVGRFLKVLGYRFFLNRSERTASAASSNLIEMPGLWVCGPQADILCVHKDSDRLPAADRSPGCWLALLFTPQYLRARVIALAKRYLPARIYARLKRQANGA